MTDEPISDPELEGILAFLRTAERLKSTPRSGWTTAGERESVAAHTWRLSLMAAVLSDRFPGIDLARLLKISVKTTETHRAWAMRKTGTHSVSALTIYAVRNGLVDL